MKLLQRYWQTRLDNQRDQVLVNGANTSNMTYEMGRRHQGFGQLGASLVSGNAFSMAQNAARRVYAAGATNQTSARAAQNSGNWWQQRTDAIPVPVQNPIPSKSIRVLPPNVRESFGFYDRRGWRGNVPELRNARAGRAWDNDKNQLPVRDSYGNPITYREFDVNNRLTGQSRDAQRFVVGSNGHIYFTDDHYTIFIRLR